MKILRSLVIFTATIITSTFADLIMLENFEDNIVNFTTSSPQFHDGSNDYFTIVPLNGPANSNTPYTNFGGSNFFAAEDMDDTGTKPSTATLSFSVNITGFENLTLSTLFAAGGNGAPVPSYDDEESALFRATIDGGSVQNLLAFEAPEPGGDITNNPLMRDTNFDGVGDGSTPTHAFELYDNLTISGTGDTLLLELIVTSNDDRSEFAFDNVRIDGVSAVPEPSAFLLSCSILTLFFRRRRSSRK